MRQNLGTEGELLAAIGPHISLEAFEVSDDVAAQLEAVCPVPGAVLRPTAAAKPHVNLRFIVTQKLLALGLTEASIDQIGGCTVLDAQHYFSFRRDGKRSGTPSVCDRSSQLTHLPEGAFRSMLKLFSRYGLRRCLQELSGSLPTQ